ncbi:MAG: fluoride efflux transporter CrcB [Alphaproteobacteria bacterium]|nr:fluoride efflux transporter CrcB [Alphaproteobacteria bacterium]
MNTVLAVAAGGAIGAVGRYLVMSGIGHWLGTAFPVGTLVVNVLGSFAMGVLVELGALVWSPSPELRAMLVVGLLGSFTTFSTFSLDVVVLVQRGATLPAMGYIVASVVLCIAGLVLGMSMVRGLVG